jgi:hypothetical protein
MKLTPQIAALYIGCEVQTKIRVATEKGKPMLKLKGKLLEVDLGMKSKLGIHLENEPDICSYRYLTCADVKLILRPLHSMTEAEKEELIRIEVGSERELKNFSTATLIMPSLFFSWKLKNMEGWQRDWIDCCKPSPQQLLWLLKNRFDLFGIIADGGAQTKN